MFKKTVDGVLTQFRKTVDDLRTINEQQTAEANKLTVRIGGLRAEQAAAVAEAERAESIASKIEKLIA